MHTRRGLPGLGVLTAPLRVAAVGTEIAAGTALLGGHVAASMGRSLARATPDVPALARAAAGAVLEAVGGPPTRRVSGNGPRRWIEVRGLEGEHAEKIAAEVLAAVRALPGVRQAHLNPTLARVVVTVADDGPSTAALCRTVADAERPHRRQAAREHPATLPGDDALLMGRMIAATAACGCPDSPIWWPCRRRWPTTCRGCAGSWSDASGPTARMCCSASSTRPPQP